MTPTAEYLCIVHDIPMGLVHGVRGKGALGISQGIRAPLQPLDVFQTTLTGRAVYVAGGG